MLIKAYEESIRLQKAEVAKRIANDTNKTNKGIATENESENEIAGASSTQSSNDYVEGDYVRVTYDADGIDYEAVIISFEDNGYCLVKFLGYDNEQLVKVDELLPSWGQVARKRQMSDANYELLSNTDINYEEDETGSEAAAAGEASISNRKKSKNKKKSNVKQLNGDYGNLCSLNGPLIPPPPPMPPMLNDLTEDSEHLSAMLMAWYMSGYYTGLYHGRRLAKNVQNASKRNKK